MQAVICLVVSYNCFSELVFSLCGMLQNGTKTANKFQVKLKKRVSKKWGMLQNAYDKVRLSKEWRLNDMKC
jgi:hypothetical protein